jgi:hypothetical protein
MVPFDLNLGNVVCDAPEHFVYSLGRLAILATADISPLQYLARIFCQLNSG